MTLPPVDNHPEKPYNISWTPSDSFQKETDAVSEASSPSASLHAKISYDAGNINVTALFKESMSRQTQLNAEYEQAQTSHDIQPMKQEDIDAIDAAGDEPAQENHTASATSLQPLFESPVENGGIKNFNGLTPKKAEVLGGPTGNHSMEPSAPSQQAVAQTAPHPSNKIPNETLPRAPENGPKSTSLPRQFNGFQKATSTIKNEFLELDEDTADVAACN